MATNSEQKVYLSTFITGMQEFIPEAMKKWLKNVKILELLDGAVIYTTSEDISRVKSVRIFNNSFIVIRTVRDPKDVKSIAEAVLKDTDSDKKIADAMKLSGLGETFRIITSKENQLVSMDLRVLEKLEDRISRKGFIPHRSKPDIEVWLLQRREKVGFFMIRITKHRAMEKVLQKGELRPELCILLNLLSDPSHKDIVLDPFSGYGGIAIERAKMPYQRIQTLDKDQRMVDALQQKMRSCNRISFDLRDSLEMPQFKDEAFDKIVTDPPWGSYEKIDAEDFYGRMIKEFHRLLQKGGIMVILTAQKEIMDRLIKEYPERLSLEKKYDILVSGKKSAIYKILKMA